MVSNVKKGNYYKKKSKEYMINLGYETEFVERYIRYWNPKLNQTGFVKKDLCGADGVSMNGEEIIFWNSVCNKKNIAAHYKEFKNHKYPENCNQIKRWIIVWIPRVREPEITEVKPEATNER